jgi:hypothetical protein
VTSFHCIPDPPVRRDGCCAVCGDPKVKGDPGSHRPAHLERIANDPFCSAVCAGIYHGVETGSQRERDEDETLARLIS